MIELTGFFFKHLYELMSDHDQNDLDTLMLVMAQNQIPNLICDTIVEFLFIFVSVALVVIILSLSEFYFEDVSCDFILGTSSWHKTLQSSY